MFPHVITYKNRFTGEEVQREYWFSLEESEIALMKAVHKKNITEYFDRIIESEDNLQIIKLFQELLTMGVGRREGNRMDKSQEVKDEFVQTGAFNALFVELMRSNDMGAGFINKMFPQELIDEYQAQKNRQYTDEELLNMTNAEFNRVAGDKKNRSKHMTMIAMARKERNRANHLKASA